LEMLTKTEFALNSKEKIIVVIPNKSSSEKIWNVPAKKPPSLNVEEAKIPQTAIMNKT